MPSMPCLAEEVKKETILAALERFGSYSWPVEFTEPCPNSTATKSDLIRKMRAAVAKIEFLPPLEFDAKQENEEGP